VRPVIRAQRRQHRLLKDVFRSLAAGVRRAETQQRRAMLLDRALDRW
jgi:hypothetical protein